LQQLSLQHEAPRKQKATTKSYRVNHPANSRKQARLPAFVAFARMYVGSG